MPGFAEIAARRSRVAGAVDRRWAERVRIVPMGAGKYVAATADPDRVAYEIEAPILSSPGTQSLDGVEHRKASRGIAAGPIVLRLAPGTVAADALPRPSDRVEALDRAPVEVFEVAGPPQTDGAGRVLVNLVRVAT